MKVGVFFAGGSDCWSGGRRQRGMDGYEQDKCTLGRDF